MPKKLTQSEFEERVKKYTNDTVEVVSPYINKRTKVIIKCKTCGYEWEISPNTFEPSSIQKGYSFSGCPKCKYEIIKCSYCSKEFEQLKSVIKKSKTGNLYCSKECGNRHKNEQVKQNNSTAYRRNAFEYYEHKCAICGYDEYKEILEVHHIDENRTNNELSNLIILCPNCHKKLTMHLFKLEELLNNK